jgi:ferredoxin
MRIVFDRTACTGHGRCYALAPEVFDADDDGYCVPRFVEVPPGLEERARTGAANCPEEAIAIDV